MLSSCGIQSGEKYSRRIFEKQLEKMGLCINNQTFNKIKLESSLCLYIFLFKLQNFWSDISIMSSRFLLIFAFDWSLKYLASCLKWHSDRIFFTRHLLFAQIYIICRYFDVFVIPCVCCPRRKRIKSYVKRFLIISSPLILVSTFVITQRLSLATSKWPQ